MQRLYEDHIVFSRLHRPRRNILVAERGYYVNSTMNNDEEGPDIELLQMRRQKAKSKTALTRARNQIGILINDTTDKQELIAASKLFDEKQDDVIQVLTDMLSKYEHSNDIENCEKVVTEIEGIETSYEKTSETITSYLDEMSSESSSQSSHIPIRMNMMNPEPIANRTSSPEPVPWAHSRNPPNLGHDMWKTLKRVTIPTFTGDKRQYMSWKAAYIACIHNAPATPEYKLLQLRQYLAGEALASIENLGHSAHAYDAAMATLERKYGGARRQIAILMEEIENFRPVRHNHVAQDIQKFADVLTVCVVNLQDADMNDELKNGSFYMKVQSKLPANILSQYNRWVFENTKTESVLTLLQFVNQEAEFCVAASETVYGVTPNSSRIKTERDSRHFDDQKYRHTNREHRTNFTNTFTCKVCNGSHGVWQCEQYKSLPIASRWDKAKTLKLCFRCLGDGHRGGNCRRSRQCGINGCNKTHNRLLHNNQPTNSQITFNEPSIGHGPHRPNESTIPKEVEPVVQITSHTTHGETSVTRNHGNFTTLRTVPVTLKSGNRRIQVNALLDDGSTKTYINEDVAAQLGLQGQTQKVTVNVLNGQKETFETTPVEFGLESLNKQVNINIKAFTTKRVTGNLKAIDWNKHSDQYDHLKGIQFPMMGQKPTVDILIGLDYADLHFSYTDIRGKTGEPVARLTPLGWTCIGDPNKADNSPEETHFIATYFIEDQKSFEEINSTLKQFWTIENCGTANSPVIIAKEDKLVFDQAEKSLKFENGHYEVGIPWKPDAPKLQNNYDMALQRLKNTEQRLLKRPDIAKQYQSTLDQYVEMCYIRKIPETEKQPPQKWYLPHFPVVHPEKTTTKVRIVFDASAKYNEISMNDTISQGPKLQNELFDVLLRMRKNPVAIVCDIAQMYLQITIPERDRCFHRFLWRSLQQDKPPDEFEFNRLVFGVNCSPFLAQLVAQTHAKRNIEQYPMAAETVLKSTYMDDSMDSVSTDENGVELYNQLSQLFESAGMHARKWLSNSKIVMEQIPNNDRAQEVDLDRSELPSIKTLGVLWNAENDVFTFTSNPPPSEMRLTKRSFLSKIAALFDPLGLLAPYTVRAKILLQEIWRKGIDWDQELDEELSKVAFNWFDELNDINKVFTDRCLRYGPEEIVVKTELHTFVDASMKAYGAVVYLRSTYQSGAVSVRMISSKSKVAPLTATSIPRLELMAAILGLHLSETVAKSLELDLQQTVFWSDSMNVLWWIRGQSRTFKPFVANRIGEIQTKTEPRQWRHVPTDKNPADMISRGVTLDKLQSSDWWNGPLYLQNTETHWPVNKFDKSAESQTELKKIYVDRESAQSNIEMTAMTVEERGVESSENCEINNTNIWRLDTTRFSSWVNLTRVSAWVNRFVNNCRVKKPERTSGELSPEEIRDVENEIIKNAQKNAFPKEYKALNNQKTLPNDSKLLALKPKLDEDGIIRSDGRLKYAEFLPVDVRFPIILPRKNWTTQLIVKHYHEIGHHNNGTNQTLTELSSRYWIISAREEIRDWESKCMECRRRKAKTATQIMAPLPDIRVNMPLRAFAHTAVDFAGPFTTIQGRGKRRQKRYLCLFTCLASRAVHLEVAFGLDTSSFLNAFYRMVSRRGLPVKMSSDNGTNFVGANRELKELVSLLDKDNIVQSTANKGVQWHFNPPLAPHFGGVHEIMIKAAKRAIYAIIGNADVTDEELMTAFTGAEGLINSRPLTYQTANAADCVPLTPNHFLHGQIGGHFAPENVDTTPYNPVRRWRRVQELMRHFWQRWLREWLPGLTARSKWVRQKKDIAPDDIVLVVSPDTPRGQWPLGRVIEVHRSPDGHVRAVKLRVGKSDVVRPITRLCPLELDTY